MIFEKSQAVYDESNLVAVYHKNRNKDTAR